MRWSSDTRCVRSLVQLSGWKCSCLPHWTGDLVCTRGGSKRWEMHCVVQGQDEKQTRFLNYSKKRPAKGKMLPGPFFGRLDLRVAQRSPFHPGEERRATHSVRSSGRKHGLQSDHLVAGIQRVWEESDNQNLSGAKSRTSNWPICCAIVKWLRNNYSTNSFGRTSNDYTALLFFNIITGRYSQGQGWISFLKKSVIFK